MCLDEQVSITCRTVGAIISWFTSDEYIGSVSSGHRIDVSRANENESLHGFIDDSDAMVDEIYANKENGILILNFRLRFTVSVGTIVTCGSDELPGAEMNVIVVGETKVNVYLHVCESSTHV